MLVIKMIKIRSGVLGAARGALGTWALGAGGVMMLAHAWAESGV